MCVVLGSVLVVHVALLSVLGLSEPNGNMMTRERNELVWKEVVVANLLPSFDLSNSL